MSAEGIGASRFRLRARLSRRRLLGLLGTATAGLALASCSDGLGAAVAKRPAGNSTQGSVAGSRRNSYVAAAPPPSIALVTIDTLRYDQLGIYGHPFVKTPALDAFGASGVRFNRHLVQEPQTNASHASLFSGMYPASSGVRVQSVDKLSPTLSTLASVLAGRGYQTAGLFSWISLENQFCGLQHGFQVYQDLSAPLAPGGNPYDLATRKGRADHTTDAAISQLSAFSKASPFFLWVHYFDPHYPYQPPGAFATMYDPGYQGLMDGTLQTVDAIQNGSLKPTPEDLRKLLALYQGEISFLDSQIGRLFAQLSGSNIVVAVTGDHGESFGEHADLDENGNFFHPHSLYSSEQQVPLLLRYSPVTRPGSTIGAITQAIDLFPTLLQLAGAPIPAQAQGASLLPLLDGSESGASRAAFSAMPDDVFTSITSEDWRLIRNNASGTQRLFNLSADPGEQHDLLATQTEQAASLGARLQGWMKEVKIAS